MRISDWSSDVCSSDLDPRDLSGLASSWLRSLLSRRLTSRNRRIPRNSQAVGRLQPQGTEPSSRRADHRRVHGSSPRRSEEHTTPVTNAHIVCRLLLENNNNTTKTDI